MRHVLGFFVGLVLTAVALITVGIGVARLLDGAQVLEPSTAGLILTLVGGLVLGLVAATRRLSPLVPLIGGATFLALGLVAYFAPARLLDVDLPFDDRIVDGLAQFGFLGGALVVGVLLVVLALVPQGRRSRHAKGDDGRDDDGFSALPPAQPQAWRPSTQPYPAAEPYQRPPLDRPSSS